MLAEKQRIISRSLAIETTIPAIVILDVAAVEIRAEAVDPIVNGLNPTGITGPQVPRTAEEIRRHMFHRVQAEAVAFGRVKRPHGGANLIILDVFGNQDA